jgi:23S rRNA (uridine2552-2'-O)-methyltransferase
LKNITFVREDVGNPKLPEILLRIAGSHFDLVVSDLAPRVSGIWEYDQARQISMSQHALILASRVLKLGGNAVFKLFEGEMAEDFKKEASKIFAKTIIAKPKASRQQSSEIYIICKTYRR